ncbi:MAG: hypothetical protein Tsb0021_01000 [Chlamydiales bacterium]
MKYLFVFFLLLFVEASSIYATQTTFILIRHGETDWNAEQRVQGHTDVPLNKKGHFQAQKLARKLKKIYPGIQRIYSSDLSRAYQTARYTAHLFELPIKTDINLRELDCGTSEGMKKSEKIALYKREWEKLEFEYPLKQERWKHTPVPGEETISHLVDRFNQTLLKISQVHPGEKIAIFSHGKAISSFLESIDASFKPLSNCSFVIVIHDNESNHVFFLAI